MPGAAVSSGMTLELIPFIAALSLSGLLPLLVQLVVAALIFWLVLWFIGWCNLPEPFNKVVRIIAALVALIFLVNLLMSLSGNAFITR